MNYNPAIYYLAVIMDTYNSDDEYSDNSDDDDFVTYISRYDGPLIINKYNIETNKYKLLLIITLIIMNNYNKNISNISNILKNIFECVYNPIYLVLISYDCITTNIGRKGESEYEEHKIESVISYNNFEFYKDILSKMYNDNITNLQYYIDTYVNKQNMVDNNYIKYKEEINTEKHSNRTIFTIQKSAKLYIINKHEKTLKFKK